MGAIERKCQVRRHGKVHRLRDVNEEPIIVIGSENYTKTAMTATPTMLKALKLMMLVEAAPVLAEVAAAAPEEVGEELEPPDLEVGADEGPLLPVEELGGAEPEAVMIPVVDPLRQLVSEPATLNEPV